MRKAAVVLASSLGLFATAASGGTNGLDATFGSGGIVRFGPTPVSGFSFGSLRALHVQDDGKISSAATSTVRRSCPPSDD